jgi:hypothetical protein
MNAADAGLIMCGCRRPSITSSMASPVHGKGAHKYLLATAGAMIRPIEVLGDFIDPLFFLGAIWTSSSLSPEEDEPDSFMTPVL